MFSEFVSFVPYVDIPLCTLKEKRIKLHMFSMVITQFIVCKYSNDYYLSMDAVESLSPFIFNLGVSLKDTYCSSNPKL